MGPANAVCRWLNLHYCKAISDKGLLHLATVVQLAHLDIGFCNKVTDRQVYLCLEHVHTEVLDAVAVPNMAVVLHIKVQFYLD